MVIPVRCLLSIVMTILLFWDMSDIKKLILLYSVSNNDAIFVLNKEFENRGILFLYKFKDKM